jgi:putative membrane protein
MKNKFTIISRFGTTAIAFGAFSFIGSASAQNPKLFPTSSPSATAAAGASASATASESAAKKKEAGDKETAAGSVSAKDKAFMRKAAKGGKMEVAMGKMASENGQSEDVKSFGKRMVTDHSKANDELMAIAKKKGVKLSPKEPKSEQWKSDKEYIDMMVKDHEKDVAEFQEEAKNGDDADLKKFAEDTATTVQKHLDLAKETQGKLK